MGLFSSSTEKSTAAQYPVNPDITRQYGSGAEQDRYGSHFGASTERIQHGIEKGVDKVKQAAQYRGEGAEQDRYNAHFSPAAHGTDAHRVQQYAESLINKAKGSAATSGSFGLGYDGQQRAKLLAGGNGSGAEQDQFAGHFGLNRGTVENAAQRVQNGARNVLEKN
ncbi:hypothetical protein HBI56_016170 [Parastagonospora nodorum]|uniref:Uncharacterized protein n=1 Tax=Phaeosphaeria nodorum (strain SN15 / ATCC MYA-4574 / FGSC 10173) TaxID=321614 RepID=A0A7U2F1B1_PHANO|nr:hypothetical protein HBH56_083810 [Parastagonospora nodorum]QRC96767.1 hypothetical protein JI435_016570 [Parastagonospora nodorum SN15]KAH3929676.1 hypothetical protein HBH54_118010 [Parastagonospora nodorum]KAH3955338.1 hypothetical protein HBH53_006540 [Parastagonospora nodorum]KAH3976796.1 hypothetical protein HBH51_074950 [Parastagonospora nodorum]